MQIRRQTEMPFQWSGIVLGIFLLKCQSRLVTYSVTYSRSPILSAWIFGDVTIPGLPRGAGSNRL
jgi:hypothetical protein